MPAAAGGPAVRWWPIPWATPPRPPRDGRGTRDDRPPRDGWGTRDDRPPRDGWGARDDRPPRDGWGVWAGPGDRSWPGGSRGLPAGCPDVLPARRPRCQEQPGAPRGGPQAVSHRRWSPGTAPRRPASARGGSRSYPRRAFPQGPVRAAARRPHRRAEVGRPAHPESPWRERILLRASHSAVRHFPRPGTREHGPRAGRSYPAYPSGYGTPDRRSSPTTAARRRDLAGHDGAYRMLHFAVLRAGRYSYETSMRISMPAVPRSAVGRVAAGAADSLAAGLAQGAGPEQVPQMKAYDCAHIQPQGR